MSPGQSRVELPREETRGRQEDLVGPLELTDLPLQLPQPRRVRGRGPRPAPGIDLRAPAPSAQRVHVDPHPWTDPVHRRRQRQLRLLLTRLTDQANRPLPQLVRVLPRCWHGPVLVGSEPPLNPGRFSPRMVPFSITSCALLISLVGVGSGTRGPSWGHTHAWLVCG